MQAPRDHLAQLLKVAKAASGLQQVSPRLSWVDLLHIGFSIWHHAMRTWLMPAVVSAGGHPACAEQAPRPARGVACTTCKPAAFSDQDGNPCDLVTLLQECLPDVLELQHDGSPELCAWLAGLLGSCAGQCPAVPVLNRLVSALTELLAHQAAAVLKQALAACQTCCRAAVAAAVGQVGPEQFGAIRCQLSCMRLQNWQRA